MFADTFWWGTLLGILVYSVSGSNGDTRIGNGCIEELSRSLTVQLQCSDGEWIHVVHKMYGDGDAATCYLKYSGSCSKVFASSRNGLNVSCNGKQSCLEAMQVYSVNNCNITDGAAETKYNCINGSMNMCSPGTTTVNGSVYLHSPGFPDSIGVNRSCVVRITGQHLQVTLVEQRIKSGMLNISGDGGHLWTNMNANEYNRVLSALPAEIVIVYDNHDLNASNVWIRVAGQMNITIRREILGASVTPTSTQQSRSQSTSGPSTLDTPTTETTTRVQSTATIVSHTTSTHEPSRSTSNTAISVTKTSPGSHSADIGHKSETSSLQTAQVTTSFTTVTSTSTYSTGSQQTQWPLKTTMVFSDTTEQQSENTTNTTPTLNMEILVSSGWMLYLMVPAAVIGVVLAIITIVLCRRRQKRRTSHQNSSTERPLELDTPRSAEPSNLYFVLDPAFTNLDDEEAQGAEATSNLTDIRRNQYSRVLPRHLRISQSDHKVCVCEMVDNFLYSTSKHELNDEKADGAILGDMDTCLIDGGNTGAVVCYMTENDVYSGGPATMENSAETSSDSGEMPKEKCVMVENDIYCGGDFDAINVMI